MTDHISFIHRHLDMILKIISVITVIGGGFLFVTDLKQDIALVDVSVKSIKENQLKESRNVEKDLDEIKGELRYLRGRVDSQ